MRDVLHGVRRQGTRGAVVAIGRHRHGHHRLLTLRQDGGLGHRRARQQKRHRRGRSAHVLRAGRQHPDHCDAPGGSEGRPRVRRSGEARVEEKAGGGVESRAHGDGRTRGGFAHRRAGRQ